jgi:S1-C subfamily serine protease
MASGLSLLELVETNAPKVGQLKTRSTRAIFWIVGAFCLSALAVGIEAEKATVPPPTRFQQLRGGLAHLGQAGLHGEQGAIQWLGTAFLVDDRCTVVTAKHAIEGIPDGSLMLRFLGANDRVYTHLARVIHTADNDLAFIKFGPETDQKRFCADLAARPLPIHTTAERSRLTGAAVWVLGYPALEGAPPRDIPVVRRGIVASADLDWRGAPMLLLDLTGMPGFSGGPVILEESGEVIGVVYGPGRTERVFDVEWATPVSVADYETAVGRKR